MNPLTMWKLTLDAFAGKTVRMRLASGEVLIADIQSQNDVSARVKLDDGRDRVVDYVELREVTEA